jgi:lipopolysaccharide export system protein LptA
MKYMALALALLAAPVAAQEINLSGGGPVEITAEDAIEWRQAEQVVIARGRARAVRDGTTVTADRLVARYRNRPGAAATPAPVAPGGVAQPAGGEIFRLEAQGNVVIATATDRATADMAVYDVDQAVLILTGRNLVLSTPQDRVTARDSVEYYPARRMAVARGNAVAESPGRRLSADTLVAYFLEAPPQAPAQPAAQRPAAQGPPDTGRLDRVEAYGNVEVRTEAETVRGDRAIYSAVAGIARLSGNVRITRGQNQLNGALAEVNLRSGVSRLLPGEGGRVVGLVVPNGDAPGAPALPERPAAAPRPGRAP